MGKATGLLLATLGFGAATYVMMAPDTERVASEKLASLVRIAAEGTRTVAQSTARSDRAGAYPTAKPPLIGDRTANDPNARQTTPADEPTRADKTTRPLIIAQAISPGQATGADQPARRGSVKPVDDDAKRALSRSIQTELKRVGCFQGEADGAWNSSTRAALKTFIERINATLPVNEPDYILLTLLQGEYHLPGDSAEAQRIDRIVQGCLAKDPRDRYATTAELAKDLVPTLAQSRGFAAHSAVTISDAPTLIEPDSL